MKPSVDTQPAAFMKRRQFLATSALSAFAIASSSAATAGLREVFKERKMGIVVHSYATRWNPKVQSTKYAGFADALDLITHCHEIGAGGVQVVVNKWTLEFAKKVRSEKEKRGMYLEGSLSMPFSSSEVDAFEENVIACKTAGMDVIRTVCTTGRRYEIYHSAADFEAARTRAIAALQLGEPILRKHKVRLGVENHKDWRAGELADLIKKINSEWVGVTLDFGNSIALMEDPMEVIRTLAPFAVSTHVKDMGLEEHDNGLLLSEVPLGDGILDLNEIVSLCKKHNPNITFNLEMITRDPLLVPCLTEEYWATFGNVPASELAQMLRFLRTHKSKEPLPRVSQLSVDERLAEEEQNIIESLRYSENKMGLK